MITVRPYEPNERGRWNQFVRTARNSHFLFERDYMEYHADRFIDASLMFESRKGLAALLPAHRRTDPATGRELLCSHEGLTFAGLITGPSMRQATMERVFEALREHLSRNYLGGLHYRAMPSIYSRYPGEEDLWCLHRHGARLIDMKVVGVLRGGGPPTASKNFRVSVRNAHASGIEVDWWDDIEGFHTMLSTWLHQRHGATPVHSANELRQLSERFPDRIRILAARRRGRPLAAELIFVSPVCTRVQYAANTLEGMAAGADQAIIMRLQGTLPPGNWLDLGASMDPATGGLDGALHAFKESCGARSLLQRTYQLAVP